MEVLIAQQRVRRVPDSLLQPCTTQKYLQEKNTPEDTEKSPEGQEEPLCFYTVIHPRPGAHTQNVHS